MSTQYTEHDNKPTIKCKICDGNFVPGGVRIELPNNVCIWCFTRGSIYRRMTLLWEALSYMAQTHYEDFLGVCHCKGCEIYRLALPIMEPSASIQESESKPSDEGRKEVSI